MQSHLRWPSFKQARGQKGKTTATAPARLQRLLLRCARFNIEVKYRCGETIPVADALSRVCLKKGVQEIESQGDECCGPSYNIHFMTDRSCPINMDSVKSAVAEDPTNAPVERHYLQWMAKSQEAVPKGVVGLLEFLL